MNEAARKVIPISDSETLGQSLLQRIGNTPLLRFQRIARNAEGVEVLAKAEWTNPGGSVKDRAAASIGKKQQIPHGLKAVRDDNSKSPDIAYAASIKQVLGGTEVGHQSQLPERWRCNANYRVHMAS